VQNALGFSVEAPKYLSCKAVSPTEIAFRFSRPVTVVSLRFDPDAQVKGVSDGAQVRAELEQPRTVGAKYVVDLLVADEQGNTLNVLIPFRARNDDMPSLAVTEVRTEYSSPRVEFVEFKTLRAGNLGGLRMYLLETGPDEPFYEFPPVMAAKVEYIVVHLRNLDGLGVDETGADLGASPYTKENEAQTSARDFWVPGAKKHLQKKAGAVYFLDQDDAVLDALVWSQSPDPWGDEKLIAMAEFLSEQNAWTGANGGVSGPADAVPSGYGTATRTLCRREDAPDTGSAADWYTAASSCATPGKVNNSKTYTPSP
jgi:hypothetical protein